MVSSATQAFLGEYLFKQWVMKPNLLSEKNQEIRDIVNNDSRAEVFLNKKGCSLDENSTSEKNAGPDC